MLGSYGALDGGSTLWALEALTGDYVFKFKLESSSQAPVPVWKRYDLVHPKEGRGETLLGPTPDVLSPEEMFETMLFYSRR
ncbi:calpain catalytic domain-containing protein [Haematococcus lacustris]|uniref:Calpain catalytic domain-containing protein n=1 Tax=Haematococcus lacustris TaxID=44745 RepID=A0A699ZVA9_HAELA|nr:calpain catalytic domain-containing protein [Haematococcus lacustris]